MSTKTITRINKSAGGHWVGDGFPVHTMFSYGSMGMDISPFLLLDYAGPMVFDPSDRPRGVEEHPHRGFETVTIVYSGEVEHGDNAGNSGKIGPGDVQWMTAGRGILHEEKHSKAFAKNGGTLEMIQLWVNLPASHKMTEPRYQEILDQNIPIAHLGNGGGKMRVISGEYNGIRGPAKTFTPINLWDIRLNAGHDLSLDFVEGYTTMLLVLRGEITIQGEETIAEKELAMFSLDGKTISFSSTKDAMVLVMNGQPIDEPIVGHGPFVMNTQEEIYQALDDYRSGRF